MDESWRDEAACRNHPGLDMDAWFEVVNGSPKGQGAEAMMVCRRACPVMTICRERYRGEDAIAGGGWYDGKGEFHEPNDELLDVYQTAAYLGISASKVRRLMGNILPIANKDQGRSWFRFTDVVVMEQWYGPPHGSTRAYRLHGIRGEVPCRKCEAINMSLSAYAS